MLFNNLRIIFIENKNRICYTVIYLSSIRRLASAIGLFLLPDKRPRVSPYREVRGRRLVHVENTLGFLMPKNSKAQGGNMQKKTATVLPFQRKKDPSTQDRILFWLRSANSATKQPDQKQNIITLPVLGRGAGAI
jgi:hypothetical protein